MFINNQIQSGIESSLILTNKESSTWALVVKLRPDIAHRTPRCMRDAKFCNLASILEKSPIMVRSQFQSVFETKKPEELKRGKKDEMQKLHTSIEDIACECVFCFDVVPVTKSN